MESRMSTQSKSPACFLRWTVQKVADRMYAVAATIDGVEYDFVGNYKSIRDAQKAGRRYATDLMHNSMSGGQLAFR